MIDDHHCFECFTQEQQAGQLGQPRSQAEDHSKMFFFLYDVLPKIRDASRISAPGQLPRKEVFLYRSTAKENLSNRVVFPLTKNMSKLCAFIGPSLSEASVRRSTSPLSLERLGESGATHDSQSASRSGVEAWVARNLNGWDESDARPRQGWVRVSERTGKLAPLGPFINYWIAWIAWIFWKARIH